jgi:hypothetical protein
MSATTTTSWAPRVGVLHLPGGWDVDQVSSGANTSIGAVAQTHKAPEGTTTSVPERALCRRDDVE